MTRFAAGTMMIMRIYGFGQDFTTLPVLKRLYLVTGLSRSWPTVVNIERFGHSLVV